MATARFVKTGITPDEYDQMRETLGVGDTPPPGGVFHAAAVGEDGKIRVLEVWDSREQAEAWGEKVMAVRTEAGFGDGPPAHCCPGPALSARPRGGPALLLCQCWPRRQARVAERVRVGGERSCVVEVELLSGQHRLMADRAGVADRGCEQELSAFAMGVVVAALAGSELSACGAADGTDLTMGDSCSASAELSDHQAASSLSGSCGSQAGHFVQFSVFRR